MKKKARVINNSNNNQNNFQKFDTIKNIDSGDFDKNNEHANNTNTNTNTNINIKKHQKKSFKIT